MGVREIKKELFALCVEKNHRCADLDERIKGLQEALEQAVPFQQITCGACNKRTTINKITAVTEYYWNENVGGTGVHEQRGTHFVCPKCKMPDKNNKRFTVLWRESPKAFKDHEEHKP